MERDRCGRAHVRSQTSSNLQHNRHMSRHRTCGGQLWRNAGSEQCGARSLPAEEVLEVVRVMHVIRDRLRNQEVVKPPPLPFSSHVETVPVVGVGDARLWVLHTALNPIQRFRQDLTQLADGISKFKQAQTLTSFKNHRTNYS